MLENITIGLTDNKSKSKADYKIIDITLNTVKTFEDREPTTDEEINTSEIVFDLTATPEDFAFEGKHFMNSEKIEDANLLLSFKIQEDVITHDFELKWLKTAQYYSLNDNECEPDVEGAKKTIKMSGMWKYDPVDFIETHEEIKEKPWFVAIESGFDQSQKENDGYFVTIKVTDKTAVDFNIPEKMGLAPVRIVEVGAKEIENVA